MAKDKVMEVLDTRVIILLVIKNLTVYIHVYRIEPLSAIFYHKGKAASGNCGMRKILIQTNLE
jgi:hypothetical protein